MAKAGNKVAAKKAAIAPHLQLAHRIELLLRTMRVIERHEEQLCMLMTEIRSAGMVSPTARKDLQALLEELPAEAYQADLDAVERSLVTASTKKSGTDAGRGRQKTRVAVNAKARRAEAIQIRQLLVSHL